MLVASILLLVSLAMAFEWHDESPDALWAPNCDFFGNDLKALVSRPESCGNECLKTFGCTHFTWYKNTCYLKYGGTSVERATYKEEAVCGIRKSNGVPNPLGSMAMDRNGYRLEMTKEDIKMAVDAHNYVRSRHGAPPVSWSDDLFRQMNSVWDYRGEFKHSKCGLGENLFAIRGAGRPSLGYAINSWASELPETRRGLNNHFTQVVWKSTTKIACQTNHVPNAQWEYIVICVYKEPGNVIGHWDANVQLG